MRKTYSYLPTSFSFSNAHYSGDIPSQTEISETSIFTSCTFNTRGSCGGAIYFTGSGASLTVTDSVFNKCNSTSDHGGAIYCGNCGKVSIMKSAFIVCASPVVCFGGGIYVIGASAVPEITVNNFISCEAGQDGGGLYLIQIEGGTNGANLPVRNCKFIGCIANGILLNGDNDADAGGLLYWQSDYTLGISNSVFAKCESKKRCGGSSIIISKPSFSNVIRFCFYCENIAPQGRNALVHFSPTNWEPWDIVFFHSFTSDSSLTNSLVLNLPAASEVNDDWLPFGDIR